MSQDAIAGLQRTQARLEAYADANGLRLSPELAWPGQPLPAEQLGPVRHAAWSLGGVLPGGVSGRLRHQAVYGRTFGIEIAGQHTIMVCRIPESVGYIPMLSVRAEGLHPSLFYWGGDRRPREDVDGFESMELDRRYIVEVAKGQDPVWLRELFPPSFIDWLAASTPVDFGFRLDGGVFTCECPQYRGQHRLDGEVDFDHLDLLLDAGGQAAGRIRDEVREEAGASWGSTNAPSAAIHEERSTRRYGRLISALVSLAGGALDDSVKEFGERNGMTPKTSSEFHANHITLPLPGTADDVLTGPLPGTTRQGDLAWLKFSSEVDLERRYVAAVIETDRDLPNIWVDADDVTLPGFGAELAPAALALARDGGYGISSAGRKVCLYIANAPASFEQISASQIEALCPTAVQVAEALATTQA